MARKKKYNYFSAFEEQVTLALKEANLLAQVIVDYKSIDSYSDIIKEAHEYETAGDKVNRGTFEAIAVDFITPFDREDIIDISRSLDDIIDKLESAIRQFYILDVDVVHPSCKALLDCIIGSLETLLSAQNQFSDFKRNKKFRNALRDVNDYEERADDVYMECMHNLFLEESDDPIHVIRWMRIFDKLEECCDACEHVGDVMDSVVLKIS